MFPSTTTTNTGFSARMLQRQKSHPLSLECPSPPSDLLNLFMSPSATLVTPTAFSFPQGFGLEAVDCSSLGSPSLGRTLSTSYDARFADASAECAHTITSDMWSSSLDPASLELQDHESSIFDPAATAVATGTSLDDVFSADHAVPMYDDTPMTPAEADRLSTAELQRLCDEFSVPEIEEFGVVMAHDTPAFAAPTPTDSSFSAADFDDDEEDEDDDEADEDEVDVVRNDESGAAHVGGRSRRSLLRPAAPAATTTTTTTPSRRRKTGLETTTIARAAVGRKRVHAPSGLATPSDFGGAADDTASESSSPVKPVKLSRYRDPTKCERIKANAKRNRMLRKQRWADMLVESEKYASVNQDLRMELQKLRRQREDLVAKALLVFRRSALSSSSLSTKVAA